MGVVAKCTSCSKIERYDSGEIYEKLLGSWYVNCSKCDTPILVNTFNLSSQEADVLSFGKKRDVEERARTSDIREYWIQEYFKENYHKYSGFTDVEGPFGTGPDFKGKFNGVETYIEIERNCACYIQHKHHLDSRWDKVSALVVLSQYENDEKIESLPPNVVYLNVPDFVEWFKPKAKTYAIQKQQMNVVERIAGYFKKMYYTDCGDKERDMVVCPSCELCPYFREGTGEGWTAFQQMALSFIAFNGIGKAAEDKFDIGKVDHDFLCDFYNEYAGEFLY